MTVGCVFCMNIAIPKGGPYYRPNRLIARLKGWRCLEQYRDGEKQDWWFCREHIQDRLDWINKSEHCAVCGNPVRERFPPENRVNTIPQKSGGGALRHADTIVVCVT